MIKFHFERKWGFWIRFFGKGFSVTFSRSQLFSARNGYRKICKVGPLFIEILK